MQEKRLNLTFTSLGHFTNDSTSYFYPVLITYYEAFPGANYLLLGSMVIIFNLISGFLSTPVASYADRKNNHSVMMALGIFILGISVILYGLPFLFKSELTPLLTLATVFLGIGQSFYHPLGAAIISRSYGRDAPPAMGLNGSMGSLGRALIPTIIVFLLATFGDFTGMIVYAAYILIASFAIFAGLSGFRKFTWRGASQEQRKKSQKQSEEIPEGSSSKYMTVLYILTAAVFIRSLFLMGTTTFIPTYLTDEFSSKTIMSYIVTLGLISPVFGQPLFGRLTSLKGGRYSVIVSFVISTIFFGLFILITGNYILTTIFYFCYAFGAYSGFPIFLGYVGQIVPPSVLGKSNGLVWGIGQTVGGAVGAAVITGLVVITNVKLSIDLMMIFAVASLFFLPLLPSRAKMAADGAKPS